MMLAFGIFVFARKTLPYQDLQRQVSWRHPTQSRVGTTPASQFLGRDADTINLTGILMPEFTGGRLSLALLEAMADQGKAWPLIEGTGYIYGLFVVDKLSTTSTLFFQDGAARRIEFQLSLKRVDDGVMNMLGELNSDLMKLAGL